jgi:hypothetical protein
MKGDVQTIGDLLKADRTYRVPRFQRDYAWTEIEVDQLWRDVQDIVEHPSRDLFLGTIVLKPREPGAFELIDGQQRLVTLSMVFCAIRAKYSELDEHKRAEDIYRDFLGERNRRTLDYVLKLNLNELNHETYETKIIASHSIDDVDATLKDKRLHKSNRLLVSAYTRLYSMLKEGFEEHDQSPEYLYDLEDALSKKLKALVVVVQDEADAYQLFETLNNRGLDLSVTDLLKNFILSISGDRVEEAFKKWREITAELEFQDTSQFLLHYWVSKYGRLREKELYEAIKDKIKSDSQAISFLRELGKAAAVYAALENTDDFMWQQHGTRVRKFLQALRIFKVKQCYPLLLAGIQTFDSKYIQDLLHAVLVFVFRYNIIGSRNPGDVENKYSDLAIKIRDEKLASPRAVFNELKELCPTDEEFAKSFEDKEIKDSRLARYVLVEINNYLLGSKELGTVEDEQELNLEHILPKSPSEECLAQLEDPENYREWVARVGNLTLIKGSINRKIGNQPFKAKKEKVYTLSKLPINENLVNFKVWSEKSIKERQSQLAQVALKIWRF